MPSGGDQAWWVAFGIAFVAAAAQLGDRLIARWRPRVRRPSASAAERLERERRDLAHQWEEYRIEINRQLGECRTENAAMRGEVDDVNGRNLDLRGEVASLRIEVSVLEARLRAHGVPDVP